MIAPPANGNTISHSSHSAYDRIVRLASDRAGLTFPDNRRDITESAVRRAMAHLGISNPNELANQIATDPNVLASVLNELTIGETYFFRDPAQWNLVRNIIAPDVLRAHSDGRGIRAWSAGCASGEEAYTLSIALRETGCVTPAVIGSDLSEYRLARARKAVYSKWSMRGLDDVQRHRYFRESGQTYHLLPEYRDVQFRQLNLASTEYGYEGQELWGLDVILCRNVLIYIDAKTISAIFSRLVASLREGGWLMIAASDPQPSPDLPLDVVVTEAGLLFRKNSGAEAVPAQQVRMADVAQVASAVVRAPDARLKVMPVNDPVPRIDDLDVFLRRIRAYANRGEMQAALQLCLEASVAYPSAAELYVLQSVFLAERGEHEAARDAARRALYIDRTLAVAHIALGTSLLKSGDPASADRALRAAERALIDLPPTSIVPSSDGAAAGALLDIVRTHRALLERGSAHAS